MSIREVLTLRANGRKRSYNRNLGIAFGAAIALHALLIGTYIFALNVGEAAEDSTSPIDPPITICIGWDVNITSAKDIIAPSSGKVGESVSTSTGTGGTPDRAGEPIPVPDALISPELPEFATVKNIGVAFPNHGDSTGSPVEPSGGISVKSEDPITITAKSKEPDMFEFVPVEKEPGFDMAALQGRLRYPAIARDNNIEGQVVVRVLVDKTGHPVKFAVQHSDNKLLEKAAAEAVMNTTFTPAIQNQNPVQLWISIPVTFQLN